MPDELAEMAEEYIPQLIGRDAANAFFGLIEADHGILPILIDAYHAESDGELRAALVEVIWQHRQESVVDFLGEALRDDHPAVWKEALNGLVTLGADEVLSFEQKWLHSRDKSNVRLEWIEEALDQILNRK